MKIRKKEPSIGIVGKILNAFSSSKQDTYSADYINSALEEHYSTEETFTGKYWIDGKKIYRKVINVGTHTFSNGDNKFAHGISNLETVIDIKYSMYFSNAGQWYTYWSTIVGKLATNTHVILSTNDSNTFYRLKITIEYTKTTD